MLFEFLENKDNPNKTKLFNENDGLEHGNMFKNLYEPYKNYQVKKLTPKSEMEALMLNVQKYSFALNDLSLYLDLNPDDKEMYDLFLKYNMMYQKSLQEFETKYHVLTICDDTFGKFTWDKSWPWEGKNV